MDFAVEPPALRHFARGLDTLAAAAARAHDYTGHLAPRAGGGAILQRWVALVQPVEPAVAEVFAHLQRISDRSADELVATARHYETTDHAAAARADAKADRVERAADGRLRRSGALNDPLAPFGQEGGSRE